MSDCSGSTVDYSLDQMGDEELAGLFHGTPVEKKDNEIDIGTYNK